MGSKQGHAGASITEDVSHEADEAAARPFLGEHSSDRSSSAFADVTQDADEAAARPLSPAGSDSPEPELSGTGFSYRHDWGLRRGQWTLRLNWGAVNPRSRILVSIGEGAAGGPDNGKFVGGARCTLHNVAPRAGGVDIWVNIEWGSDILLYADYLVVNP